MQASEPLDPRAVLGAVKAQPGNAGASRKPSATAGLDRPCARRDRHSAGRTDATQHHSVTSSALTSSDCGARLFDQLFRRHNQANRDRSPRLASLLGSFSNPCFKSETMDGDSPSNSRRRSTCFLMLAGSSGSAPRYCCRPSPISRQIARLCVWSISMALRMAELPSR